MTDITVNRDAVISFEEKGITISTQGELHINGHLMEGVEVTLNDVMATSNLDGAINQIRKTVLHNARQMELLNTLTKNGIVLEDVIKLIAMFVPSINSDLMNHSVKNHLIRFMQSHCEKQERDNITYKAADDFINLAYKMKAIVEN